MSNASDPGSRHEGPSRFAAMGLVLVVYFATRLFSLGTLPIFLDEAVHIQWAERLFDEGRILRPIGAGRLLAVAAYGLALPFEDRLWGARFVAVGAGAVTLIFTMLLSRRLFGTRAGLVAGALYVMSPFALVYDRLALSDGFLAAAITGVMLLTLSVVDDPRRRLPWIGLAAALALAIVSKISALLFLLTIPLGVLALAKDRGAALRSSALAIAAGLVCASPMLWFFAVNSGEIAAQHLADPARPGSILPATLRDMEGWLTSYFTASALFAAAGSLALIRDGRALWLGGSFLLPLLLFAVLSQPWSARYILPVLPPFLIAISGGIEAVVGRMKPAHSAPSTMALVLVVSLQFLAFDRRLLGDPANAPFPADDRYQLVTGWPAGYGVREVALRLKKEGGPGPVRVFVDAGGTRTLATSLAILLAKNPDLELVEGDFKLPAVREALTAEARRGQVFAVLAARSEDFDFRSLMASAPIERVEVYSRPGGEWAATLFRVGVGSDSAR